MLKQSPVKLLSRLLWSFGISLLPLAQAAGTAIQNGGLDLWIESALAQEYRASASPAVQRASPHPVSILQNDFAYLQQATLRASSGTQNFFELPQFSGSPGRIDWSRWVGARLRVITMGNPLDHSFWQSRLVQDRNIRLEQPAGSKETRGMGDKAEGPEHVGAAAVNFTKPLLREMIAAGHPYRYQREDGVSQLITGAHFGFVFLNVSFFDPYVDARRQVQQMVSRIFRLATLVHEARHGDGMSDSDLGFVHWTCPQGHDHAGQKVCDRSQNGSYGIQAEFVREFVRSCAKADSDPNGVCTPSNLDQLSGFIAFYQNRVLDPQIYPRTAEQKKVVPHLDARAFVIK